MDGCDVVVHCAAALPLYSADDIYTTDVVGTRTVLEAALDHKCARAVHISSTAVYGIPDHHPLLEDDKLDGVGPYGQAKIQAEMVALDLRAKGMVTPIIRPKSFIGPERLGVFSLLYDWALDGRGFPILGNGRNRYQLLDVEDLCQAIWLCLTLPAETVNDTFNVGAAEFGTMKDDYQAVLDEAGFGKQTKPVPGPAGDYRLAAPGKTRSLAALQMGLRNSIKRFVRFHRQGPHPTRMEPAIQQPGCPNSQLRLVQTA